MAASSPIGYGVADGDGDAEVLVSDFFLVVVVDDFLVVVAAVSSFFVVAFVDDFLVVVVDDFFIGAGEVVAVVVVDSFLVVHEAMNPAASKTVME
ncbi:MAG: hypothetical protein DLM73_13825 [Chthoniobacterales bacterium]|nr:MAG: hypothetical protein DLM73_13825 [Chthoniobacterales bacterium]